MEEILKQLLEGQKQITERLNNIEATMATKADIQQLEAKINKLAIESQKDVFAMLQHIYTKTDGIPRIEAKLDIIAHRLFEQEAEIQLIKKAK